MERFRYSCWLFLAVVLAFLTLSGCHRSQKDLDEEYRIPVQEVLTEDDFSETTKRFMVRNTVDQFQKYASPHSTNAEAALFLEEICEAVSSPGMQTSNELAQKGARLIAAGCNDPLVRLWYGQIQFMSKQDAEAEPYLLGVYQWDQNSYPDIHAFLALRTLACIAARRDQLRPDEAKMHLGNALGALSVAVANHEFSDNEIQIAYRWLNETSDAHFDKWDFVLTNLELQNRTDEAGRLFEDVLSAYRDDHDIQAYLRDRIALLRLDMSPQDSDDLPLIVAARENREDVVCFLLDHNAAVDVAGEGRWQPLHWAAARDHIQMAELLLDRGADPNAPDDGLTPLHLAIKKNRMEMMKVLVSSGADLNAVSIDRWTPLHYAIHYDHADLARWLIQNGANIHARGEWGWTPLLFAVSHGQADTALLLIAQGARVDEKSDQGWTPLLIMTWNGNEPMVKLLLENGADKKFVLDDGRTALSIARQRNFKTIEHLLQNHTVN